MAGVEMLTTPTSLTTESLSSLGTNELYGVIMSAIDVLAMRDLPPELEHEIFAAAVVPAPPLRSDNETGSAGSVEVTRINSQLVGAEDGGRPSSDEAVVELLRALKAVPMTFETLEATKIGRTVAGLRKHASEMVCELAGALYRSWKSLADEHLRSSSKQPPSAADVVGKPAAQKPEPLAAPAKKSSSAGEAKLASTKRKLQEGYKEAETAKKQRMIQIIDAPRKANQQRRTSMAVIKQRSVARFTAAGAGAARRTPAHSSSSLGMCRAS